ncbi:MAG: leucine-rich repeat protein [Christensenellaceae bacterium]|jgi:uncharacterized repeat protein (TIGR02543 family)|nr:leucine-rich repeat protein [Christensenellaceae bacterium]
MIKQIKLSLLFIVVILLAIIFTACGTTKKETQEHLLLENEGAITFTIGNVDLSHIRFKKVGADGEIKEYYTLEPSMLSDDHMARLNVVGTHGITITADGLTLSVTINILPLGDGDPVKITFDAGLGFFQSASEEDGPLVNILSVLSLTDASLQTLPSPVREGYEFSGWYKSSDLSGTKIELPYPTLYEHTLYAKWVNATKRAIRFIDYDANLDETFSIPEGESYTLANGLNQDGKLFVGWRDSDTNDIHSAGSFLIASLNKTFYAVYEDIKFKISLYADGYKSSSNLAGIVEFTVSYGSTFETSQIPDASIAGKSYIWRDQATSLNPVWTNIRTNMTVVAEYTGITYTLNFYMPKLTLAPNFNFENLNYSSDYALRDSFNVDYDSHIANAPVVSSYDLTDGRKGYAGVWQYRTIGVFSTTEQAIQVLNSGIKQNYDFYARYTVNRYIVSFVYGTGLNKTTETKPNIAYNTQLLPSDFPNLSDYPQKEWTTIWYKNNMPYNFEYLLITENLTFEASHTLKPFSVEFYYPQTTRTGEIIDYSSLGILDYTEPVIRTVSNGQNIAQIPSFGGNPQYKIVAWVQYGQSEEISPAQLQLLPIMKFYDKETDSHFTAIVEIIKYTVIFKSSSYVDPETDTHTYIEIAKLSDVPYNSTIQTSGGTYNLSGLSYDPPVYTNAAVNEFTFIGWHEGSDFATSVIDFDAGFIVVGEVSFYAEWIDYLKGTPGLTYNQYAVDAYEVTGFNPDNITIFETVVIPEYHNNLKVDKINASAFANAYYPLKIENLLFGSNITTIDVGAFKALSYLESFGILDTSQAFFVDDGVLYEITAFGLAVFAYPASKKPNNSTYDIPSTLSQGNVIAISDFAFALNKHLTTVNDLASSVTTIGNYAFYGSQSLTSINFSGLNEIGESAFQDCEYLSTLNGDYTTLIKVNKNAFEGTAWFVSHDTIVVLGNVLLNYRGSATTLYLSDNITVIAPYAFKALEGTTMLQLTMVVFDTYSNISVISKNAFTGSNVSRIKILRNEKISIEKEAFGADINVERTLEIATNIIQTAYREDPIVLTMFKYDNIIISVDEG